MVFRRGWLRGVGTGQNFAEELKHEGRGNKGSLGI